MKGRHDGFSLIEVVAAIAILGIFFGTACSALVLGLRMNEKTDAKLQAQLEVSSAVETLMAEGIDPAKIRVDDQNRSLYDDYTKRDDAGNDIVENGEPVIVNRFHNVTVEAIQPTKTEGENTIFLPYFEVTVKSEVEDVTVTTCIREAVTAP